VAAVMDLKSGGTDGPDALQKGVIEHSKHGKNHVVTGLKSVSVLIRSDRLRQPDYLLTN
jgi:hypothetical protein